MANELVHESNRENGLAFPPLLRGYARDLTMTWLLSYDSPNTRDAYRREIERWFNFCAERDLDPLEARRPHGDVFKRWLELKATEASRVVAPRSMGRTLAAVSSWYTYLADEEAVDANRFQAVRRPKVSRKYSATKALTKTEGEQMLAAAAADRDSWGTAARTRAFIRLLQDVGIRVSEALAADISDYGMEQGLRSLRIIGKGGKERRRRVPAETAYAIDLYLQERADRAGITVEELSGPLFATTTGKRWQRSEAFDLVKRIGEEAGLSGVTPHVLRHTWATRAKELGIDPRDIQEYLDHEDLNTTMLYLHAATSLERDPSQLVASSWAA